MTDDRRFGPAAGGEDPQGNDVLPPLERRWSGQRGGEKP